LKPYFHNNIHTLCAIKISGEINHVSVHLPSMCIHLNNAMSHTIWSCLACAKILYVLLGDLLKMQTSCFKQKRQSPLSSSSISL
jgi:hypothetical protein